MTPNAYLYISWAYLSVAALTTSTLCLKGYNAYKDNKYIKYGESKQTIQPLQYVLHALHIPPYLIAAYWYYDSYELHNSQV